MLGGANKESVGKRMKAKPRPKPRPMVRTSKRILAAHKTHLPGGHFSTTGDERHNEELEDQGDKEEGGVRDGLTPRCFVCGEAVELAAQNIGRTGPISPDRGGITWGSLLFVALLWAVISAIALNVSLEYGMRRRTWAWAASFLVSTLVAAYSFWRLV